MLHLETYVLEAQGEWASRMLFSMTLPACWTKRCFKNQATDFNHAIVGFWESVERTLQVLGHKQQALFHDEASSLCWFPDVATFSFEHATTDWNA